MARTHRFGWKKWVIVAVIVLVAVRVSLPYVAQSYMNNTLAQAEEFTGRVGDVDIMLWRGAFSIEDIIITKRNGEVKEPLFQATEVQFSLLWSALVNGAFVGTVDLYRPEINFVDGDSEKDSQSGESEDWLNIADQLFPLKIDKLNIQQGRIVFHNPTVQPEIHLALHDIKAELKNLVNSRDLSKDLVATFNAKGQTAEAGTLAISASLDPSTKKPTFDVDMRAENIALVNFKNFLDTYAPFDLEAGSLEMAMELASSNGQIKGYAKPILHNVEVFSWKGDVERDNDGFFQTIIEMGSALISEIFENQKQDQIATRIPIEGSLDSPDTPILPALGGILKNAFIEAMRASLEGSVELENAEEEESQEEAAKDDS
ncbi:DUF748 domain-containing protein [Alteromonas pelagimontana]|uniref:DUF748 domain-containing protein n=1 Tax=Alteromonas pelagimontana TaxID=1858656 RepID=A0A6M4MCS5_9ALTE|nr:DUF748 domain-containing protein [Alteromonas pelagimontana]QJR80837.1 DUF748 domain-containing protein [Alteromonas pelagimontana]